MDGKTDRQMDNGWTDGRTDRWTDTPSYRDARTHLKRRVRMAKIIERRERKKSGLDEDREF